MAFSHGCDLSTVIPPEEGEYRVFDRWKPRLDRLAEEVCDWPEKERMVGELFCKVYLIQAPTQDWFLMGLDDLVERNGEKSARMIWNSLTRPIAS
jgi:hypothetical protein